MVTYDEFTKLDLRVGKILEVNEHPNANKLYVLKVDIGEKLIQLVAGLRPYYTAEELRDKYIVVLVNLEKRIIRGIESEGMLLAAQSGYNVSILIPYREVNPGSIIR
ncbi:MAG: hypothetical protein NC822_02205 [Candidatus Omnitrophica bacterium]|nr:hypothetical protein [Candidatus Omnitrophota bacterium]MCM8827345.1 hypothetical protein [Candidatus Omnitrophota bacterium]